ncbi:hypothetical protein BGZ46_008739 [Entomortierella lignicola]|nr:hypothetical protein BGZ46_008739 [Entomortierella lignicola]
MAIQRKNVIVIGGGMAGISAAIELSKHHHNIQVTLLEARDHLGGRISTHRSLIPQDLESSGQVPKGSSDLAFDFGASWIHGVDPSNPIFPLINSGHIKYIHTDSDEMFLQPGSPALPEDESNHYWKIVWDILDEAQEYSANNRDRIPEDHSLRDWLTEYLDGHQSENPEGEKYMSELVKNIVRGLTLYWADENAIPMEKVSMKYMDTEDIFPGEHCLVTNGYDRMIKAMTATTINGEEPLKHVRVLLEHVVDKIEYNESEVKVSTNHGTFTADQVLVTLPLGVLKSQSLSLFSPSLPPSKQNAIVQLGFASSSLSSTPSLSSQLNPTPNPEITSRFNLNSQQVYALTVYMKDMANYSSFMPVYNLPVLVGYATNHAAELLETLSDDEARSVYMCHLAHYYPILLDHDNDNDDKGKALWSKFSFMTRWNQDPFAKGSYTSIPIGATPEDIQEFQVPVGARVHAQLTGDDDYEHYEDNGNETEIGPQGKNRVITSINDAETGRIFFAGEHTSSGHFASVQGALLSGRLGATKILGQ